MALLHFLNYAILVKDFELFNNYPWGSFMYKKKFSALKHLYLNPGPHNKSKRNDITDFPMAFQVSKVFLLYIHFFFNIVN